MVKIVKATNTTGLPYCNLAEDPEFIKACENALQDPVLKAQIICILQHAGLIQSSDHQPV